MKTVKDTWKEMQEALITEMMTESELGLHTFLTKNGFVLDTDTLSEEKIREYAHGDLDSDFMVYEIKREGMFYIHKMKTVIASCTCASSTADVSDFIFLSEKLLDSSRKQFDYLSNNYKEGENLLSKWIKNKRN
jgi:hypothetical protein